ncbi:response regulator transcription factor [Odoribacter sp. AF15-53]|uniref:response regulator transcription factor n=1 Tax=Odoribacter sp. AF15-53 TaxID=2292236 RepID=UPI000E524619|nr:response regulator transcription factor [Odoribacter sp. AF15-53]RHR76670.1 DNA-binding response regulator [Odoribacter sp. AF15-53]
MGKKVDILYAEDDERTARMVKDSLEEHEFQVRVVYDGVRAWDVFRYNPPDLLLVDLEIPGKDGLELVECVRKINERVPIIFYSSHMDVAKELEAIKLGADDCIRKGVPVEFLIAKLNNVYRRVVRDDGNHQVYFLSEMTKFNAVAGLLTMDGQMILLKTMDARLLHLLCVKMHEVAGYEYLIRGLWGNFEYKEKGNALRKGIIKLKKILEPDTSLFLSNTFGEGYVLSSSEF